MFLPLLLYLTPYLSGSDKEAPSSQPLRVVLVRPRNEELARDSWKWTEEWLQ